jgi:hypothetical protein
MSEFPSLLQSAEDARRAQLTRQECQDTWNPNLTAWLIAHKCATAAEREQYQINWRIQYLVRQAEARIKNNGSKAHWDGTMFGKDADKQFEQEPVSENGANDWLDEEDSFSNYSEDKL